MYKLLLIALLGFSIAFTFITLDGSPKPVVNEPPIAAVRQLWKHVYHPQRLQVIDSFKQVSGTIYHVAYEADGDAHIELRLDAQYNSMLNAYNIDKQHGCLVIEPIFVKDCTQQDACSSKGDYTNTVYIPRKGDVVYVTGSYVLDTKHGWKEIHPVVNIKKIK